MKRVAIQGFSGAYHEIAARNYFREDVDIVPCLTFEDIFLKAVSDNDLIGIMAIENTIAGSLLPNHNLLRKNKLKIVGEYKLRISHVLSALPGQKLEDIKEIASHPMALMQCERFLNSLSNVKLIEHEDTALSAKEISENKLQGCASICSKLASQLYNLEILAEKIETNKMNFTRFLILANENNIESIRKNEPINKSSIVFVLPHTEGSLARVLSVLSYYGVNLTRIQSLPIVGRAWEYQFYIDLTFPFYDRYKQAVEAILPLVNDLKILGEYTEDKDINGKSN